MNIDLLGMFMLILFFLFYGLICFVIGYINGRKEAYKEQVKDKILVDFVRK